MKVTYRFVNETVEIDVTDEWGDVLAECDRQEYNSDQTETRRHVSMDMMAEEQGVQFADPSNAAIPSKGEAQLREVLLSLTEEQRHLVRAVLIDGMSLSEYAKLVGVSQPAITQRLSTIRKKVCKVYGQPYN